MKTIPQEKLERIIQDMIQLGQDQVNGLYVHYHLHDGTDIRDKALESAVLRYGGHSAERAMKYLALKMPQKDTPSYLGTACAQRPRFFGLLRKPEFHTYLSLNRHHFPTENSLKIGVLHGIAQAMYAGQRYLNHFKNKSSEFFPILPRREKKQQLYAALRGDVFASLVLYMLGQKDAPEMLARERGLDVLSKKTRFSPEQYPFIMAIEALKFSCAELGDTVPKNRILSKAYELTENILKTFEVSQIQHWWSFAKQAQEMAWNGYSKEEIISFAINTSEDPHIRAMAMMIADMLELDPDTETDLYNQYNAFASHEQNMRAHKKAMDKLFEQLISKTVKEKTSRPIYDEANAQNLKLTEGRIFGWCAYALQEAGRSYDNATEDDREAIDLMRSTFSRHIDQDLWRHLKTFSKKIIQQNKQQGMLSMDDALDIARSDQKFSILMESMQATQQDPAYIKKLQAANDMAPQAPQFSPAAAAPSAPASRGPIATPSAPSSPAPSGSGPAQSGSVRSSQSMGGFQKPSGAPMIKKDEHLNSENDEKSSTK